jgi:transcriptional regulator with XRE-family HTH domain
MSDDCKPAPGHDLGRVLAVLRASRSLSKTDLANASGVPSSNISQYELGHQVPELKTLRRLLTAMGYTLAAIEPTERYLAHLDGPEQVPAATGLRAERIDAVAAEAAKAVFQWTRSCLAFLSESWASPAEPTPAEVTEAEIEPADPEVEENLPLGEPPIEAWSRLARKPLAAFRTALDRDPSGADPHFVEWLGARSVARAAASPDKAREDAERALAVAEGLAPKGQHSYIALSLAFLGNAVRLPGDFGPADELFSRSEAYAIERPLPPLLEARRLDLLASLRREQRRFDEALIHIDRALGLDPKRRSAGRRRLMKAKIFEERGDLEAAIVELRGAAGESDALSEPRLLFWLRHNLADYLSKIGRFVEAKALVPEVRDLCRRYGGELDEIRLRWIEGRIAAGLGRADEATAKLGQVRGEYLAHGLPYDAALAALELATFYLRAGRTEQVKDLARQMLPVFQAHEIHREALAAITLFRQAAEQERATLALAERVGAFLLASRANPGLAFEGGPTE